MAYTKSYPAWHDTPATDTPINAAALNNMEQGIYDANLPGGGVDYIGTYNAGTAYKQGDVVLYNGVQYLCVNPGTGQTPPVVGLSTPGFGTALPGSPVDGQEFILTDSVTAPTYQWRFRYVSGMSSNKWVFIGGSPKEADVLTSESYSSGAYGNPATVGPSITVPQAGRYRAWATCEMGGNLLTADAALKVGANAAVASLGGGYQVASGSNPPFGTISFQTEFDALAADVVTLQYFASNATVRNRRLSIQPVRVT